MNRGSYGSNDLDRLYRQLAGEYCWNLQIGQGGNGQNHRISKDNG